MLPFFFKGRNNIYMIVFAKNGNTGRMNRNPIKWFPRWEWYRVAGTRSFCVYNQMKTLNWQLVTTYSIPYKHKWFHRISRSNKVTPCPLCNQTPQKWYAGHHVTTKLTNISLSWLTWVLFFLYLDNAGFTSFLLSPR